MYDYDRNYNDDRDNDEAAERYHAVARPIGERAPERAQTGALSERWRR